MNKDQKLSLADFNRKLRKYCANAESCAVQEEELVSRMETLVTKRDSCLEHIAKEKENEMLLSEEIEDLKHQQEEALELFATIEKRCKKLAFEKLLLDGEKASRVEVICDNYGDNALANVISTELDEKLFKRILRKYCNVYVQFNERSNTFRVLSLEDHSYFEIGLNEAINNESRTKTWSKLGSSSVHLNSWENLL